MIPDDIDPLQDRREQLTEHFLLTTFWTRIPASTIFSRNHAIHKSSA